MQLESTVLVRNLLQLCNVFQTAVHIKAVLSTLEVSQASTILGLHYGVRVSGVDDSLYRKVTRMHLQITHIAANPSLPDFIAPLAYLPVWRNPWERTADKFYKLQLDNNISWEAMTWISGY
jgi:hypothetical protein